jgi:hypothetical protein
MSTAKATDAFEEASLAVLARAQYLNVVPARDTRSASSELTEGRKAANAILHKFTTTRLTDGEVFTYDNMDKAHEEAVTTLQGATDELNSVRVGFAHYYLRDPISMIEDPSVPVESDYLWKMADIVGAVLCGGPCSTDECEEDVYGSLLPGDWFQLATFMVASVARGCVRSPDLTKKGAFDVEPSKDDLICDSSLETPKTQAALLQALAAQVMEELRPSGALLPIDSETGLQATIWRAHEGQIRAWTEKEVLSVYERLSDICLADIMDKLEAEAPVEEITDIIREEIAMETRGKYQGLLAQEKTKAFNAALEEARSEALREARAKGEREAEQKGRSYGKMQLDRAEDEAHLEAARIYKNRLQSVRAKMAQQVEAEVCSEHDQVLAERRSALEAGLAGMDFDAKVEHIRSLAVQVGLLDDSPKAQAGLPKRVVSVSQVTITPLAAQVAGKRQDEADSATVIARFIESSAASQPTDTPPLEPSPCPAAGEDDLMPRAEVTRMDWVEDTSVELPSIDFDTQERSSGSSIHCAANAMLDDSVEVVAVSSFRDPDSGALPLPDSTPAATPTAPVSEAAKLFDLIMATIDPIKAELKRIGDKVDGRVAPTQGPPLLRLRRKYLVSAVMTTRAESRISHGLLVVRSCTRYLSADVALVSIVFGYHMYLR